MKLAIYSDNGGEPGNLLPGAFTDSTPVIAGWNIIPFPTTTITCGQKYWLARNSDGNILYWQAAQPGALFRYKAAAFSGFSFPGSAGTGFTSDQVYHLVAGWHNITPATTPLIGCAMNSPFTNVATGGYFALGQFTAVASGDITEIRVRCASSGNMMLAIYSDNGGEPGNLLSGAFTGSTPVIAGWNTITFPTTSIIAGTKYWLARNSDGNILYWQAQPDALFRYKASAFSGFSFPGSAGGGFTSDQVYHLVCCCGICTTPPTQKLIGSASDSPFTNVATGGYFALGQFTADASGDITEIRVRCASSGSIKLAIYSDSGGEPGDLLSGAFTGSTPVTAGWNIISFPTTTITGGQKYWLARNSDGNILYWQAQPGARFRYKAAAFSGFSFPGSAGGSFTSDQVYHLIAGWGNIAP